MRNLCCCPIRKEAPRILFLTSTRAGEGKTFTALNLAAAYAQTGKKVLLIDGDLRKASLSAFYGGKNARGLVHLLMNPQVSPDSVLQSGKRFPGFDLVTAGPVPPNPVALLTQGRLEELLRYWRAGMTASFWTAVPMKPWRMPPSWRAMRTWSCMSSDAA